MKTLKILSLLLIAGVLFSCEKDIEKDAKQDVVFGINEMDPSMLKTDDVVIDCVDLEPTKAYIKLKNEQNDPLEFNPDIIFVGGKPYTKAIRLDPGEYEVMEFYLYTIEGGQEVIIMATPMANSIYSVYVTKALQDGNDPFTFEVIPFEKIEVEIDVLCYQENDYLSFGFFWFQINRIVIREICFFGDFCIKSAQDYVGSLYGEQVNFPGTGYYDAAAIFQIVATKSGQPIPHWDYEDGIFTNEGWFGEGAPLCVQYPDNIDIDDEEFVFELQILVKVGDNFQYVPFHTWTFYDNHENIDLVNGLGIPTDDFGVADFVLGSCAFNPSPETLVLPPYQNLPEKADIDMALSSPVFSTGAYWSLNVNNLDGVVNADYYEFPWDNSKTYLGWCGSAVNINAEDNIDFWIYSSLNDANWIDGLDNYVSVASLAKVNWLFNNLPADFPSLNDMFLDTDNFSPITAIQGKELQHAIWQILGVNPAGAVGGDDFPTGRAGAWAQDANQWAIDNGVFVPLPGGYAAVLMVKDNLPTQYQLVFTVVDP